ncbi:metalloregulator ArsR/SmtB family transcription factor [Flavobacterium sp. J372]|uniref:ArsR/SmtB family transcription factor n=1 Tax=Flavobacterium sp. J372 TaxID=2898436 RepID=UPI002150BF56|nr:metalloregulator ArsR/SmtB family transcription factor [Flavobacterium sp. J372]MCR5861806.1 metalloregulator ArsR/SmtB family transcription factor [Flavobacterium sp. J372]
MTHKEAERIAKALGDPHRLRILNEMKQAGELKCACVTNIIQLSQPSISHHLKQLVDAGLIIPEKEGRNIKYRLDREILDNYITYLSALK